MERVVTAHTRIIRVREQNGQSTDEGEEHEESIRGTTDDSTCTGCRKSCCLGGTSFFDALKAMVTRQLFLIHSLVAIYRVASILGEKYWLLAVSLVGILIETAVVLIHRRGKEWSWFQPSVLLYLISVVPAIWLLEMDNLELMQNSNFTANSGEMDLSAGSVNLIKRDWLVALEQSLLVLIIIGRWLIPKGDLSRDQLSSLLITNLGTASDIVDFYSILDESHAIMEEDNLDLVYVVLIFWTWSLLQFPFVRTSKKSSAEEDICDGDNPNNSEELSVIRITEHYLMKIQYMMQVFLETEGWAIFVTLLMQDGPFFIIRIISIFYYKILTYTNYFFATKNALIVALQIYRIVSIYLDYKAAKEKEMKRKRNLHNYKPQYHDYTDLVKRESERSA